MAQTQQQRRARKVEEARTAQATRAADPEHQAELKAKTEAVLDDIDALLDELGLNQEGEAEAMVAQYVQKGGQ